MPGGTYRVPWSYRKKQLLARKKAGLCEKCNDKIAPGDSLYCLNHRIQKRRLNKISTAKRTRKGLCTMCFRRASPSSKFFCEYHRLKVAARRRELKEEKRLLKTKELRPKGSYLLK